MWFFLLLHLALLSTLKSDVKHLFGISCMIGCTILLGTCAPRKLSPPNPKRDKNSVWFSTKPWGAGSSLGMPIQDGRAPWPALCKGREAAKAKNIKQDSNAEASLYNEIWDSDHRNVTCWKPQLSRVNTCPHSLNLSATHSCCPSSQHSWVCAERKYYSQILQLFF